MRRSGERDAPSDEALLARAREGDHGSFRRLVERYEPRVARTVIGMMGAGAEAEDVGQRTFLRFYESLDDFRGDASLGTYLTRIAMNESLRALERRDRHDRRHLSRDDEEVHLAEPSPEDVEEEFVRRERARAVRGAIEQLDPKHRAVVTLRMIEGCDTRETAETLGIAYGTVLSRLSRALDRLEPLLAPYLEE